MTPSPNGAPGTGIDYPQITLGGNTYTLKVTRGALLYRFSARGIGFGPRTGHAAVAQLVNQLHAMLEGQYFGSPEDLSELITSEDKWQAAANAVDEAVKKVSPAPTPAAPAPAPAAEVPQAPVQ